MGGFIWRRKCLSLLVILEAVQFLVWQDQGQICGSGHQDGIEEVARGEEGKEPRNQEFECLYRHRF